MREKISRSRDARARSARTFVSSWFNILNHDDTKVRANAKTKSSREREIFSRVCFLAFKQRKA